MSPEPERDYGREDLHFVVREDPAQEVGQRGSGVVAVPESGHIHGHQFENEDIGDHWADAGPIIEREKLSLSYDSDWRIDPNDPDDNGGRWYCSTGDCYYFKDQYGATPLIAAMRCYVASKLGEIVEVPRELYKEDV